MAFLLPSYVITALYCAIYMLHCFQKKHWLPAAVSFVLMLLPIACGILLLYFQ